MHAAAYAPGAAALAVVGPGGAVLVQPSVHDDLLVVLASVVAQDAPPEGRTAALLDALTRRHDGALSGLPPFAAALRADLETFDVVVRGPYTVSSDGADGRAVDGRDVTSWREERLRDATTVRLGPDEASDEPGRWLPLTEGVALVAHVRLGAGVSLEPHIRATGRTAAHVPPPPAPPQPPVPPLEAPVAVPAVPEPPVAAPAPAPTAEVGNVLVSEVPGPGAPSSETTVLPDDTAHLDVGPGAGAPARGPATAEQPDDDDYGYLWGHTVRGTVESAAVRPDEPSVPGPESPALGDHDGQTVHLEDFLAARGAAAAPPAALPGAAATAGPQALSRFCDAGHASPPHATVCRTCGAGLDGAPRIGPRPSLGRLRLADGTIVELDRSAVLGRRPAAQRVAADDLPRLVALSSREVSRDHVEVRVEDWNVLAVDLGSRNGTVLLRPGNAPVRLTAHAPVPLRTGDTLDLGDGVTLVAEDLP